MLPPGIHILEYDVISWLLGNIGERFWVMLGEGGKLRIHRFL